MRLRAILLVLSLLAFFSASAVGYLYYSWSRQSALREAERQAALAAETIRDHLSTHLNEYLKSAKALAGLSEMKNVLLDASEDSLSRANATLDHFQQALGVDVCYLMDEMGNTLASSNRSDPDSFVGENYAFRPYFRAAMRGRPSVYMGRGITSKKRGVYYSHPVHEKGKTLGVLVVKAAITLIERHFHQGVEGIVALVDPTGLLFISNQRDWLYQFLWQPSPQDTARVAVSRQFGEGPFGWTGLKKTDEHQVLDASGRGYTLYSVPVESYPGWSIVYLQSTQAISQKVSFRFIKVTGFAALACCLLIGVFVFFLYNKASYHISQRKAAEEALRESEETTRALLNAPTEGALLLDTEGVILALNKTAADRFGKSAEEVIGTCAFDLFELDVAETRRAYHEQVIRTGRPVRYEDRRNGRWLNTNVYPVFDGKGKVRRVAIFSGDVTDQKRAEKALRLAKEEVTRYSRELETRVKARTEEISGILKYTPAAVCIKDREARYTLVNSKFEQIFGVTNDSVVGKRDHEIFPRETAERIVTGDLKVIEKGASFQGEQRISQKDGIHTYLVIKFPLYNEKGLVHGLCQIATDITAIKKAEDQLRRLSASIISSQEKERAAIARELHDELGQMLTALRFEAVWIWEKLRGNDPNAAERALGMCELVDKTIDEVRAMSFRLRPGVLDDLGLLSALEWYTSHFAKRTGIACSFSHDHVDRVDEVLATAAYRIAQEALTNAARHSGAREVKVVLENGNGEMCLSVIDDGKGFNPEAFAENGCLGIAGMRERATLARGSLEIHSRQGEGTEVLFRVPAAHSEEALP
ncbi:MAG: PAS domain-containing protein [Deltaproteobacteria bacterium]|nr:PAS domain-containing protein [Deltaproteobacteria bacterium]